MSRPLIALALITLIGLVLAVGSVILQLKCLECSELALLLEHPAFYMVGFSSIGLLFLFLIFPGRGDRDHG